VIGATQFEIAASHWRNRHMLGEFSLQKLDPMTPERVYFNTNTQPNSNLPTV
jgi:hypothetical protein